MGFLHNTTLYIDINSVTRNPGSTELNSYSAGWARMQKLVEPLRQLHSLGAAQINGPLSGKFKDSVIESVCRNCPTTSETIHTTVASLGAADDLASKGQLGQARVTYKAALSLLRSCDSLYQGLNFIMDAGPFPGLSAFSTIHNMVVRLQARIADTYLRSEKLRMARIYIHRATESRHAYDHRYNRLNYLDIQPWEYVVYAEVLHVAAKISYSHGHVLEALRSLLEAGDYVPFDEEQTSRYENWQAQADELYVKHHERNESRCAQRKKQIGKVKGKTS